jgi:hypothetical protein
MAAGKAVLIEKQLQVVSLERLGGLAAVDSGRLESMRLDLRQRGLFDRDVVLLVKIEACKSDKRYEKRPENEIAHYVLLRRNDKQQTQSEPHSFLGLSVVRLAS